MNKVRDFAIVKCFKIDSMDYKAIAEKFNLTERRILQILVNNHAVLKRDKKWEKEKRINVINRLIKSKKEITNKDIIDLLAELRKEIEGEEGGPKGGDSKIIIIYPPSVKANENTPQRISSSVLA